MAQAELNLSNRERLGKGGARSARRAGLVPGVVYGADISPCVVTVEPKALQKALATDAGWNTLLTLRGEGAFAGRLAVVKDMQLHPLRRTPEHVDFQAIDMSRKQAFMVPVLVEGRSKGEKEGGTLELIRKELEVYCLPTQVPSSIDVPVAQLEIGDVVHIEDIKAPEGVELVHDVNFTVITVVGHKPSDDVEEGSETSED